MPMTVRASTASRPKGQPPTGKVEAGTHHVADNDAGAGHQPEARLRIA